MVTWHGFRPGRASQGLSPWVRMMKSCLPGHRPLDNSASQKSVDSVRLTKWSPRKRPIRCRRPALLSTRRIRATFYSLLFVEGISVRSQESVLLWMHSESRQVTLGKLLRNGKRQQQGARHQRQNLLQRSKRRRLRPKNALKVAGLRRSRKSRAILGVVLE